jgi:hypothetical protein
MAMLNQCRRPGCSVLTLGRVCAAHEAPVLRRVWPKGRPFSALATAASVPATSELSLRIHRRRIVL